MNFRHRSLLLRIVTGVVVAAPGKKRRVRALSRELRLQPLECMSTFPVHRRHVDIEQSKKTVRLVLNSRRLACSRPGHAPRDRRVDSEVPLAREVLLLDFCAL